MYLDYAASTPILPNVKDKLIEVLDYYGNPSSLHSDGQKAKKIIDDSSDIIANLLNCNPEEIYYTSGATMSNNLAIQGFIKNTDGVLITDKMEHDDILLLAKSLKRVFFVKCLNNGFINLTDLNELLDYVTSIYNKPILVSIQSANSETGVIQNITKISEIVHRYPNAYFHTDATQYIPYYKEDVKKNNIDMLSMSGQKIGCIKGIGLLYVKNGVPISPIIYGDQGLIGGTENVFGICCLAEAFKSIKYDLSIKEYRDYMIDKLDGKLIGNKEYRLPNNLLMLFRGVSSELMIDALDYYGISVSGGSACSTNTGEPSSTLLAMGMSKEDAKCCLRFTLPPYVSYKDIDEVCKIVNLNYKLLRG